nr:cyclic phosphodiesterase-like [Tanacetum cinerariifolium]
MHILMTCHVINGATCQPFRYDTSSKCANWNTYESSLLLYNFLKVQWTTFINLQNQLDVYSVWALPPPDVSERVKKLMVSLRSEFGGPEFEPHVTVVGAIRLTEDEAREKCVFLLLHKTPQVLETGAHCWSHFGYKSKTPYMPHLSILYADLTDEEKKKAQERANALDGSIKGLSFPITRLALYKTDTKDKTLKSWEKHHIIQSLYSQSQWTYNNTTEFGGPEFEPHVTVVGAIRLTEDDACEKLTKACDGLKAYNMTIEKLKDTGKGFLLHKTPEVMETGAHCWSHFGYKCKKPYTPHLSIL